MEDNEIFDLTPQIECPTNSFKIIHIHNRSETYHLTRQVLLDSMLTQNTYCFFYHILSKNVEEFNHIYGSFAFLISRSAIEADIYLNVHPDALNYIVTYIQTTKINIDEIFQKSVKIFDEIVELAIMFGMPLLVSTIRQIHQSEIKQMDI